MSSHSKIFSFSNLTTVLLFGLVISMFVFPEVKATMIRGLMTAGLFQPDTANMEKTNNMISDEVVFADVKRKKVSLSSLKGKVVFINFWATWCPPCRAEMPSIQKLYTRFKNNKNVVFLLVDADGKPDLSANFMERRGFDLPVCTMVSEVPQNLFSGTLPTTAILDKSGRIVYTGLGAADYSSPKVIAFIEQLLK